MKIEEIDYTVLLDIYKNLLTQNKAEVAELYFLCDLSLSEIAEIKNCTRQSVLDTIKSVKHELDNFEAAVGFKAYMDKVEGFKKSLPDSQQKKLQGILK